MASRLGWKSALLLGKSIAFAVFLSMGCSAVSAESDGVAQELETETKQSSHTVVVGDTLWNVALRLRPPGMAMAQAMDAVYEHNPDAFLEGDSTRLIEGSVITFPATITVDKAPDIIVSEENVSLIIPEVDPVKEPMVESTELLPDDSSQEQDIAVDDLPADQSLPEVEDIETVEIEQESKIQQPKANQEDLVIEDALEDNSQLFSDSAVQEKPTEVLVEQLSTQPFQAEKTSELEQFLAQLKSQDAKQTIAKLKQLPVDLWFFVAAILIAIIINRSKRKSPKDTSLKQSVDPLAESVLDGPFAEGDGQDDVFTAAVQQPGKAKIEDKSQTLDDDQAPADIAMNLPGLDELKAQLSEDNDQAKPLAKDYEPVSFEEDTMEIDPLQIKLDMASLCIEMGDIESAQSILEEIISEADKQGKAKAREILNSIET
jgi:FimV-like protein